MKTRLTPEETNNRKILLLCVLFLLLVAACAFGISLWSHNSRPAFLSLSVPLDAPVAGGTVQNVQPALSVPTQMTKIGDDYFIVDCYHNQILTSTRPDAPLTEWYVMTDRIDRGHTIAGDGTVYLADDTENNRILIFEKKDGLFYLTQTFDNIGIRPHYVIYDEASKRFLALSSMTGELYVFARSAKGTTVGLEKILTVPELDGIYVRSFTTDGDDIYFVSGNRAILRTRKHKDTLEILERFPVPDEIAGMIQLTKIQNYFYITVSTDLYGNQEYATLLRVPDLTELADGSWEDIYSTFIGGGTPYYISSFDGHYYLTEHRISGHGVWQFDVNNDQIEHVVALHP